MLWCDVIWEVWCWSLLLEVCKYQWIRTSWSSDIQPTVCQYLNVLMWLVWLWEVSLSINNLCVSNNLMCVWEQCPANLGWNLLSMWMYLQNWWEVERCVGIGFDVVYQNWFRTKQPCWNWRASQLSTRIVEISFGHFFMTQSIFASYLYTPLIGLPVSLICVFSILTHLY